MAVEKIDTLIIGAGQAGIATSEHLSKLNVPHLVLEKNRIAEGWRTMRWDSLVANGPAWHDRSPGLEFEGLDPDAFAPKERGVSTEPGVYFVGLPWLSRRGSTFIWGVWHDAKHIADHIATQHKYLEYKDPSQR